MWSPSVSEGSNEANETVAAVLESSGKSPTIAALESSPPHSKNKQNTKSKINNNHEQILTFIFFLLPTKYGAIWIYLPVTWQLVQTNYIICRNIEIF